MSGYNLGTAQGRIVIDPSGAVAGSRVAQGAMGALKTGFGGVSKSAAAMGLGVAGAGLSVGGAFVYAVNSAASFEQRMSAVKAVSGATSSEMQQLSGLALQLGADTSFSASEAASAIEELVKAGISVPDVMNGAAAATVALAAAGEIDLPQAATIASNAMNQFGLSAKEMPKVADLIAGAANASAIDVGDFGMSLSQVGAVAKLAGLNFEDTAIAIAEMGNAGIKGSDAGTSLKSMLSNLNPTTEKQIGLMQDLGLVTKDGANAFYDSTGKLKSLRDIQSILGTSLKGLTTQQKQMALETIFGSDAIRAAAILAGEGAAGYDKMNAAMGKMTAADVAKTRMDNLKGSIEQFTGSLETVAIKAGQIFLPMIRNMVEGLTGLVNFIGNNLSNAVDTVKLFFGTLTGQGADVNIPWMNQVIDAAVAVQPVFDAIRNAIANVYNFIVGSVIPSLKIFAQVFGPILAAAIGAVIVAVGKASDVLQPLGTALLAVANYVKQNETAFRAIAVAVLAGLAAWKAYQAVVGIINLVKGAILSFKVAMTLLNIAMKANVIGIIITAITALVAAFIYLWNNNEGFRNFFLNMWASIQSAVQAVVGWFQGTVLPVFQAIWSGIQSGLSAVASFFTTTWASITSGVSTAMTAIQTVFSTVWNAIVAVVTTVFNVIMTIITTYINIWRTIITTVMNAILAVWSAVWGLFGPLVKAVWDLIIAIVQFGVKLLLFIIMAPIRGLLALFQLVWNGIQVATAAFWSWISPYVSAAVNAIRSVISNVFNAIRNVVVTIWNAISAASSAVWNAIRSVVSSVVNGIRSVVSSVFNAIRSTAVTVWNAVKAAVTGPIQAASGVVSSVVSTIRNAISNGFNAAKTAAINAFNALKSGVSTIISSVTGVVSGVVNSIKGVFSGAGGWLLDAGKRIVQGLIQGITNMIGAVKEKLNFLTNLIPDWKGPASKDKVLLEQNGELIMSGLIHGIENMVDPLAKTLGSITSSVPTMAATGTMAALAAPQSALPAGASGDTYITIQIDPKDLPGLAQVSDFVENIRQQARQRSGKR